MTPAADAFLNHLRSDAARTVFERYGFRVMAAS
jgi:ABC-type molybdate transport system substrate-binding protein